VPWPFAGPAILREGDEVHLVDGWCYMGTAKAEDEIWALLESAVPRFDPDTYRLLHKVVGRMKPVPR